MSGSFAPTAQSAAPRILGFAAGGNDAAFTDLVEAYQTSPELADDLEGVLDEYLSIRRARLRGL